MKGSYPSEKMQSVYSTALADWTKRGGKSIIIRGQEEDNMCTFESVNQRSFQPSKVNEIVT